MIRIPTARWQKWLRPKRLAAFFLGGTLTAIGGLLLICYLMGPPPMTNKWSTTFYANDDTILGEQYGNTPKRWVSLEEVSPHLIHATILAEDKNFYKHHGFAWKRIFAAALQDIRAGAKVEGGSTITQQYAKNLYLTNDKTWTRKFKEAIYSIRLEMFYSKEEILEGYLNTIYYGHGMYGIQAASDYYMDKDPGSLTAAEAALLAGIPKGPSYYSPFQNKELADERQEYIYGLMQEEGYITEPDTLPAVSLSTEQERDTIRRAGYFQDYITAELADVLGMEEDEAVSAGYHVHTTMDPEQQLQLEMQIADTIPADTELEAGAIAMNPHSGAITAMVGGTNYKTSTYNRATTSKRMPGSAFKPFVYYTALKNGFTPMTQLKSEETTFKLPNGGEYAPGNYHGYYANDDITMAEAIAMSDNIYAVKTNLIVGAEKVAADARKLGITSDLQAVPSLALGTSPVSVEEMGVAYSRIANGGKPIEGYTIEKIVDRNGKIIYSHQQPKMKSSLDKKRLFVLTDLMTGMFDDSLSSYMRVTGAGIKDQLSRPYAGKSGTTATDSWMVGFSPDLVTAVWTGYDDNRPMEKVKELGYSKEIWAGFMEAAHEGVPIKAFRPPAGVRGVFVDPDSGLLATSYCEKRRFTYFVRGTEPKLYCHPDLDENPLTPKQEAPPTRRKRWFDWLF
ncbi:transglycosylase domain-containing protein [Terribacillus sp. 7520-G]|uniref:transglycosylase domain-containing protein n=1 Tax=Terribacillus sp. 7520-G TaxID=2025389 RepID=UPI000BA6856F|nr:PBP1A family penicillin-binding protein [Terribacillus sp. 7520-G]PAD40512.1 monofunctional biosynthetic peptidoglycan transglycosylase [Terribacillus sp. 7520-G]